MKITQTAQALAERTLGAYSVNRYRNWRGVAQALLSYGLTERQAEAVMWSKWMRWAADFDKSGARYGRHTSKAIIAFLDNSTIKSRELNDLVYETFGGKQ